MVMDTGGSGTLDAADVFVTGDSEGDTRLELRGDVFAQVQSSLHLNPCSGLLRGCTPPLLQVAENAMLDIGADISLGNNVEVDVSSSFAVGLGGNLNTAMTSGALFDWSQGHLLINGATPQAIEAAGADMGVGLAGTINNFLIGTLEVDAASTALLVNSVSNVSGSSRCEEAVYVKTLILRNESTIDLGNVNIYYGELIDEGSTKLMGSCGSLVHNPTGDHEADGDVDLIDYAVMSACLESSGPGSAVLPTGCGVFDFDSNGEIDLRDYSSFTTLFLP